MATYSPEIIQSILDYISRHKDHASDPIQVSGICAELSALFGVPSESSTPLESLLKEVPSTEGGDGGGGDDSHADLKEDPVFQAFMKRVTDRGYFKGCTEGDPVYEQRFKLLVAKFTAHRNQPKPAVAVAATTEATVSSTSVSVSSTSAASAPVAEAPVPTPAAPPVAPKVDAPAKAKNVGDPVAAEAKKAEGNAFLREGRVREAIDAYTEAIALSPEGPSTHIYYSNRSAARMRLNEYDDALDDARVCVELNPEFSKGFARVGAAHSALNQLDEAVEAYETALRLDPSNDSARAQLSSARQKSEARRNTPPAAAPPAGMPDLAGLAASMGLGGGAPGAAGGAPGGMPDLSALAGMASSMGLGGGAPGAAGGAPGGMPDLAGLASSLGGAGGLAGLMGNPMIQQMMASPEFQRMSSSIMSNPAMMQQMMGAFPGAAAAAAPAAPSGPAGDGEPSIEEPEEDES